MNIFQNSVSVPLLSELKSGSAHAFTLIYRAYCKSLYNRINYLVKDEHIANELVQELFLKVWQKRAEIDVAKSFQAYLYTIAQNLVCDHFRKVASDRRTIDRLLCHSNLDEGYSCRYLEDKESAKILSGAINSLTPQRKLVFTYCKIEGYSYLQTSEALNISLATVNTHISHSFRLIRNYVLKNYN